MNVQNPMSLTIGEWSMIRKAWEKAHAKDGAKIAPPTDDEFERAVIADRSIH